MTTTASRGDPMAKTFNHDAPLTDQSSRDAPMTCTPFNDPSDTYRASIAVLQNTLPALKEPIPSSKGPLSYMNL